MKRFLIYILSFLICYGCAQDSSAENKMMVEDSMVEEALDSVTTNNLGGIDLRPYEQLAIQKLEDFGGYIEIISNPNYDNEFKKQAMEMARALFYNGKISDFEITKSQYSYAVNDFLTALYNNDFGVVAPKFKRFKITQPFTFNEDEQGIARIEFTQKTGTTKTEKTAIISLSEIPKDFGDQQEFVWTLFILSIE